MELEKLNKIIKEKENELKELKKKRLELKHTNAYYDYTIEIVMNEKLFRTIKRYGSKEKLDKMINGFKKVAYDETRKVKFKFNLIDNRTHNVVMVIE